MEKRASATEPRKKPAPLIQYPPPTILLDVAHRSSNQASPTLTMTDRPVASSSSSSRDRPPHRCLLRLSRLERMRIHSAQSPHMMQSGTRPCAAWHLHLRFKAKGYQEPRISWVDADDPTQEWRNPQVVMYSLVPADRSSCAILSPTADAGLCSSTSTRSRQAHGASQIGGPKRRPERPEEPTCLNRMIVVLSHPAERAVFNARVGGCR